MRSTILTLLLLTAFAADAAVYRWIDADGNQQYGDSPPSGVPAEQVELPPLSTYAPPPAPPEEEAAPPGEEVVGEDAGPAQRYRRLVITQPANGQTIRTDDGLVDVTVDLRPALQVEQGHRLIASIDGRRIPGQRSSIGIRVGRGSHTLQAAVIDKEGKVLARSAQITFDIRPKTRLPVPRELREIDEPGAAPDGGGDTPAPAPLPTN
jgi:hypothetical protein